MRQLWAPWRMEYIQSDKKDECIFCSLPLSNDEEKNYILFKGTHSFVIMNIYPYNCAHLMVSPYRHISCITKQNKAETKEVIWLTHDTNFMPVLGEVKVHPEHLRSTYEKLHPHFKNLII